MLIIAQLYARRGALPQEKTTVWTTFEMPLREPAVIPTPFDFIRFLCSSITFMTSLRKITVFLNDKCLASLEKTVGPSQPLSIPKGLTNRTINGTMIVTGVRSTRELSIGMGLHYAYPCVSITYPCGGHEMGVLVWNREETPVGPGGKDGEAVCSRVLLLNILFLLFSTTYS
jgi:Protein of unknown function (DUF3684)